MRYIRDLIPISWLFVAVLGMIYFLQPAILDQIPLFARVTVYASAVLMVISQEMRHYRLKRANEVAMSQYESRKTAWTHTSPFMVKLFT